MCARRVKREGLLPQSRVCGIYDSRCAGRFDVLKSFFTLCVIADLVSMPVPKVIPSKSGLLLVKLFCAFLNMSDLMSLLLSKYALLNIPIAKLSP